jgi:hypothetical protein
MIQKILSREFFVSFQVLGQRRRVVFAVRRYFVRDIGLLLVASLENCTGKLRIVPIIIEWLRAGFCGGEVGEDGREDSDGARRECGEES